MVHSLEEKLIRWSRGSTLAFNLGVRRREARDLWRVVVVVVIRGGV
jgi:hypothetical protein